MQVFRIHQPSAERLDGAPEAIEAGHLWIACERAEFERDLPAVQAILARLAGSALLDLHVSDLLNAQLPSHYDHTSRYELMVFRRLAATPADAPLPPAGNARRPGPPALSRIDTSPVGFAVFDRLLLSVHPPHCEILDTMAQRLTQPATASAGGMPAMTRPGWRMPASPAEQMLRMVSQMVDGYLALRRPLSRQLDHWQQELLDPRSRFRNWAALLAARNTLHDLEQVGEDQRAAIQEWIAARDDAPADATDQQLRERDVLHVRARDVQEHIQRVLTHVQRLATASEAAVQMHFSATAHRTNQIMRTLTALTAIFLPLNLITGVFGMNFEFLPLIHEAAGFWISLVLMAFVAVLLGVLFWRKRYLE